MKCDIEKFEYRRLGSADVDAIMELQDEVYNALSDKSLLRKNTREMFASCVAEPNVSIGVFDGDTMIAIGIMVDARGTGEDLGVGLKKFPAEEDINGKNFDSKSRRKNINMKSVIVLAEYRGNGLQRKLISMLEKIAAERGYIVACASISPDNEFSLRNAKLMGYEVDHVAVKYGGLTRAIVVKRL